MRLDDSYTLMGSIGTGQFVLHTKALHGNPSDSHTLGPVVAEFEALTGIEARRRQVDRGYRGHNHQEKFRVWDVERQNRSHPRNH
jgi:hypothetical protein